MDPISGAIAGIFVGNAFASFATGYNAANFAQRSVYMPEIPLTEGFIAQYAPSSFSSFAWAGTYYLDNYVGKAALEQSYISAVPFISSLIEPTFYWIGALCSGKLNFCVRNKFLSTLGAEAYGGRARTKGLLPFYIPRKVDFQSFSYRPLKKQKKDQEIMSDFSHQLRFSAYKEKTSKAFFLARNQIAESNTKDLITIEEKGEYVCISAKELNSYWKRFKNSSYKQVIYTYDSDNAITGDELPIVLKKYLERKVQQGAKFSLGPENTSVNQAIRAFLENKEGKFLESQVSSSAFKDFYIGGGQKASLVKDGSLIRLHIENSGFRDKWRFLRKENECDAFKKALRDALVSGTAESLHFSIDLSREEDTKSLINDICSDVSKANDNCPIEFFNLKHKLSDSAKKELVRGHRNLVMHEMKFTQRSGEDLKESFALAYLRDIGRYSYSILMENWPKNKNFFSALYFLFRFLAINIGKCLINLIVMAVLLPKALKRLPDEDLLARLHACQGDKPKLFGNRIDHKVTHHFTEEQRVPSAQRKQSTLKEDNILASAALAMMFGVDFLPPTKDSKVSRPSRRP